MDENFDCPEVVNLLERKGVRYRLYSRDVPANSGSPDESFLPKVGDRGWILITSDTKQTYRKRELYEIRQHGVKHFVLPGNMGATAKAELLLKCKNKIQKFCRENDPPFSASINKQGKIEPRMDKNGRTYGIKEEK